MADKFQEIPYYSEMFPLEVRDEFTGLVISWWFRLGPSLRYEVARPNSSKTWHQWTNQKIQNFKERPR
jgi:hypothetical protein